MLSKCSGTCSSIYPFYTPVFELTWLHALSCLCILIRCFSYKDLLDRCTFCTQNRLAAFSAIFFYTKIWLFVASLLVSNHMPKPRPTTYKNSKDSTADVCIQWGCSGCIQLVARPCPVDAQAGTYFCWYYHSFGIYVICK